MVGKHIIYNKSQTSLGKKKKKNLFPINPLAILCPQVATFIGEEHDFLKTFSINFFVLSYDIII